MTKFNFLSLWVVIQQHTPLDVVQVNLEKNTNNKHFFPLFFLRVEHVKY